ncbi:MAG: ATP synthase subunit C [Pseudomonadota bacterium]|nr:ATP synthase subunit C [Pseudomonadota bacterium]
MEQIIIGIGWVGVYGAMALAAIGSAIGCAKAGQAACGAMLETESGHGRYIGLSAMASSQAVYGIVIMFTLMNVGVGLQNAMPLAAIGVLAGVALLISAIRQGECCASAIHAFKNKAEIFGKSIVPAAIVEGFSVFAFVFALVASGNIPGVE